MLSWTEGNQFSLILLCFFLSKNLRICSFTKGNPFLCKFSPVWFLREVSYNWQYWSVHWCASRTLRQKDTINRTRWHRTTSLSLTLSPLKHCYKSFILLWLLLLKTSSVTECNSPHLLFFLKFRPAWPFFPHMPSRCLSVASYMPGHFLMAEDAKLMTADPATVCGTHL